MTTPTPSGLCNYSPHQPLVLVTDYAPDASGGGAVILRGLLTPGERERVVWLTLSPFGPAAADGWCAMERLARASGPFWRDGILRAGAITDELLDVARSRNARALWLVMHGAVVPVAARLVRVDALPVHLTVHDDPVGQVFGSRKYVAFTPWVSRWLTTALRGAGSVDTICEAMAARYRQRLGVASTVVHRGTTGPVAPAPSHDPSKGLSVGVIGSIYQYAMMQVLGRAVARAAKQLGTTGSIVVVGKGVGARLQKALAGVVAVEATGHLDEAEAIARLRECFLLYVNYPFGPRQGVFRRTSFPTKLSTCALTARPLLVHMPADGSVVPLTTSPPNGYATHWGSLEEDEGAEIMVRLWNVPSSHRSVHEAAEAVRARYFDFERNRTTLFSALDALVPPSPAGS